MKKPKKLFYFTAEKESVFSGFHTETQRWLCRYDEYLSNCKGLANGTRWRYLFFAARFFFWQFKTGGPDWSKLNGVVASEFVSRELPEGAHNRHPITATRSLLRFLAFQTLVPAGLERAIPSHPEYKHASLPVRLSEDQISEALTVCKTDSPIGLRNYAILLLLARLGLRAKEIIHLSLDDIDWIEGKVKIRSTKSLRERSLPLSQDVGQALVNYLRNGRRKSDSRFVFLQQIRPYGCLTESGAISQMVRRTLIRAEIKLARMGAHVFRHTVATQMLSRGASFKEIADILGHKSIETTGIYAKLDLGSLAAVALPWLGGNK